VKSLRGVKDVGVKSLRGVKDVGVKSLRGVKDVGMRSARARGRSKQRRGEHLLASGIRRIDARAWTGSRWVRPAPEIHSEFHRERPDT